MGNLISVLIFYTESKRMMECKEKAGERKEEDEGREKMAGNYTVKE